MHISFLCDVYVACILFGLKPHKKKKKSCLYFFVAEFVWFRRESCAYRCLLTSCSFPPTSSSPPPLFSLTHTQHTHNGHGSSCKDQNTRLLQNTAELDRIGEIVTAAYSSISPCSRTCRLACCRETGHSQLGLTRLKELPYIFNEAYRLTLCLFHHLISNANRNSLLKSQTLTTTCLTPLSLPSTVLPLTLPKVSYLSRYFSIHFLVNNCTQSARA